MENLEDLILNLEEEKIVEEVKRRIEEGEDPTKIITALRKGLEKVGEKYSTGEYFLPELFVAGEIAEKVSEIVEPKLKEGDRDILGTIVIGTVEDDIHDIGKNLAITTLKAAGFEIYDVGEDQPPQVFVDKIKEVDPDIVGLCGLITQAQDSMKKTIDLIEEEGLRDRVMIIIGGNLASEKVMEYVGADYHTNSAFEGAEICKKYMEGKD